MTYRDFNERSARLASAMSSMGLSPGDRVLLYMDNRPELLEAMFATFRAGATVVPCNARSTTEELSHIWGDSAAALIVTDEDHAGVAHSATRGQGVISLGSQYETLLSTVRADIDPMAVAETTEHDIAWIFYTSGTTGQPKGAMLTHSALNFVTVAWHADLAPMDETDVTLHAAPLTHAAGFHALAAVAAGAHQVISPGASFKPVEILHVMRQYDVTNSWMVPTQIIRLTDAMTDDLAVPSLRTIIYGGAPMAPAAIRRAVERMGPIFVQLYGQGESPMTITVLRREDHLEELLGTAGYPRMGMEVRVVDEADHLVPREAIGEVVVRGPSMMTGYFRRPKDTAVTLRGGWLHTGDLGKMSDDGVLTLLDRTKDVIISGGSNVYAVEVEAVLSSHIRVREVAVVGVPDELWGERVEAVIVADAHEELEAELDDLCRMRLAGYKVPRRYHFFDVIPRNAYGKVVKRDLRVALHELRDGERSG